MEMIPNSPKMRFLPQNESQVFSLNNISNWILKNPHEKIYNKLVRSTGTSPAQQQVFFTGVVELIVYMEHSNGNKVNHFWKYENPETGEKVDQITPFFDAMKKARLM
jgi:hypothetical protein